MSKSLAEVKASVPESVRTKADQRYEALRMFALDAFAITSKRGDLLPNFVVDDWLELPSNVRAHYESRAEEIIEGLEAKVKFIAPDTDAATGETKC